MAKHPCPASCQEASLAFQELRAYCDEVEVKALNALTKARIAFAEMVALEPTVLVMDIGPLAEKPYGLAATGAKARSMHKVGSRIMRNNNFALPVPGPYAHDDRPESV